MQSGDLTIAAFVARTLALGDRALAKEFQAVPCSVRTVEIEKLGGAEPAQCPWLNLWLQICPCASRGAAFVAGCPA